MAVVGYVQKLGAKPVFLAALQHPRYAQYHDVELALLGAARIWPAPQLQKLIERRLKAAPGYPRASRITDPSRRETSTLPYRDGTGSLPDDGEKEKA